MSPSAEALIPMSVDPDALRDHPRDSDEAVHNTLVDWISDRGVLTISDSDLDDFYDAIKGLSDLPKTLWVKLLGALYDLNRLDQDPDALSVASLLNELGLSDAANRIRLLVAGARLRPRRASITRWGPVSLVPRRWSWRAPFIGLLCFRPRRR